MREIEFLPDWYPRMRQRRRRVILQGYVLLAVAGGLGIWGALIHRNIELARADDGILAQQLNESRRQLVEMDRLTLLRKQLQAEDQIFAKLGIHVEAARLIRALDQAMPRDVSLTGLQMEVEEKVDSATTPGAHAVDHRLHVKLDGVASSAAEVSKFMTQLNAVPYFEQPTITAAKDRRDGDHVMREFQVTFTINLNTPAGP